MTRSDEEDDDDDGENAPPTVHGTIFCRVTDLFRIS